MRKISSLVLSLGLVGSALFATGCLVRGTARTGGYVYVDRDPPPPRMERAQPRSGYIWVSGRWQDRGGNWVWMDGRYERQRANQRWNNGRWDRRGNRHVWVEGSWTTGSARQPARQPERQPARQRDTVKVNDHRTR